MPNLQRSYESIYGCSGGEATHTCHSCPDGRVREFARVRSAGFVTKGYLATLLAAPTTLATWTTGITAGKIIMLPETSGSYDPGDPKPLKGYGDRKESYGPREMKLMFNDPDYADNYAFYNEIGGRTDLVPFFRTSGLVHIFDKVSAVKAKDPVIDDLEEEVVWQVECTVISMNLPTFYSTTVTATAFSCDVF